MKLATPCTGRRVNIVIAVWHSARQSLSPLSRHELAKNICRNCLGHIQ
jgi:hypothetical protein